MNTQPLLNHIYTKSQADDLVQSLEQISSGLFLTREPMDKKIKSLLPCSLYAPLVDLLKKNYSIKKIIEELQSIPVITISLAFEPSQLQIEMISSWLQETCRKKVLIDVVVKPEIMAGAIIEYEGKYRDYTIKSEARNTKYETNSNYQNKKMTKTF